MAHCVKCNDTGVLNTGRSGIPCTCSSGDEALFSVAGVDGLLPGSVVKKHFTRGCPEPIVLDPRIKISSAFFSDGKKPRFMEHEGLRTNFLVIDGKFIPADPNVFDNIVPTEEEAPVPGQSNPPPPGNNNVDVEDDQSDDPYDDSYNNNFEDEDEDEDEDDNFLDN